MGRQIPRVVVSIVGLVLCGWLAFDAGKAGASRIYSAAAVISSALEPSDIAVRIRPDDPEAHYTRALVLINLNRTAEAIAELRIAIRLRPTHYYQWLDLGVTLDRLNDQQGAFAALTESVRRAPAFAQPRWQLGSLLFRQGNYSEAFTQLQLAAKSNPDLFEGMLDLAWVAADGDVAAMEKLINPQGSLNQLALANYLARHGKGSDAIRLVRYAGDAHDEGERELLRQTVAALVGAKQFPEAYDVWCASHACSKEKTTGEQFLNGDFVEGILQNDPGFSWQLSSVQNVSVSIDTAGPAAGSRSLNFDFNGASNPAAYLLYQLIVVRPRTGYSLAFVAKSNNIVSGGQPIITVFDASSGKSLGQSSPIATGTADWKQYEAGFSTDEHTSAITVVLHRLSCTESACPIFGKLWVSKFSLIKK